MIKVETDPAKFDFEFICRALQTTYWAKNRSAADIRKSFLNSISFCAFEDGRAIGMARVVSDKTTFSYLCDVFVAEEARGRGIAQALMREVLEHPDLKGVKMLLRTKTAHKLYEKFDFQCAEDARLYMTKGFPENFALS